MTERNDGGRQAPKRRPNGTFAANTSGNEGGRPPKRKQRHSLPGSNRRAAFAIAEREISASFSSKPEKLTLYQANLLRLGIDGAKGSRNAARLFIAEINRAASVNGDMHAFTRLLMSEVNRLEAENRELHEYSPQSGVVHMPYEYFQQHPDERNRRSSQDDERLRLGDGGGGTDEIPDPE
jgi:hypothetical protein